MLTLVDADACPVKDEVYKVAWRHEVPVTIVSNSHLRVPDHPLIERVVVSDGFDAADDWIAAQAEPGDIVITADIPLAARGLAKGARVLDPSGRPFTDNDIGEALAMRELLDTLRQGGVPTGGPPPRTPRDRSRFLAKLDETINAVRRAHGPAAGSDPKA